VARAKLLLKKFPVEAPQGERMIVLTVRLWTNKIAPRGKVVTKHAHAAGVVRVEPNETHNIGSLKPIPFGSMLDLPRAIEKALLAARVRLHTSTGERRYRVTD